MVTDKMTSPPRVACIASFENAGNSADISRGSTQGASATVLIGLQMAALHFGAVLVDFTKGLCYRLASYLEESKDSKGFVLSIFGPIQG